MVLDIDPDDPTFAIWKYPFPIEDTFTLEIPKGAQVVHVGAQPHSRDPSTEVPTLWCLVNKDAEKVPVEFTLVGTGHLLSEEFVENSIHLGTFFMAGGRLVWHLFAKIDMSNKDLALGALWTKQISAE